MAMLSQLLSSYRVSVFCKGYNHDVWYRLEGTGSMLIASKYAGFGAVIQIFESVDGTCSSPVIVVPTSDASTGGWKIYGYGVKWYASVGRTYFVRIIRTNHYKSPESFQISISTPGRGIREDNLK